jgi:hypothetical protein
MSNPGAHPITYIKVVLLLNSPTGITLNIEF